MKGGHVQSFASERPVVSRAQEGVAERSATAATAATWLRFSVISFTRTKNPSRDGTRNDHYGKGKTKGHSQKRLKMRTIEMAPAFFRCGTGKTFEFHPPGSKARQRDCEADDADDMQHIMMTG